MNTRVQALKRVALGYHHGSRNTAARFLEEAIKRKSEMNKNEVQPYLRRFLNEIDRLAMRKDNQEKAEHALLLSTVFQNAVVAGE